MNPWLLMLASGLATMKLVGLMTEVIPWPIRPWCKSAASIVIGIVLCALLSDGFHQTLILGIAAAGIAAVWHEVQDYLSVRGDETKQAVIIRSANGRRTRL